MLTDVIHDENVTGLNESFTNKLNEWIADSWISLALQWARAQRRPDSPRERAPVSARYK